MNLFLETGWGGRNKKAKMRNINMRGKHRLVTSHKCPNKGLNPQPWQVTQPGIEPTTFCFAG